MSLCDVNVWLALALSDHIHTRAARSWFEGITAPRSVLFCRATQQAFLRLLSSAAVLAPYGLPPLSNRDAWSAYDALLADERTMLQVEEPGGLESQWRAFALRDAASPKLWMDAYLAAFGLSGGHRVVTTDATFRQFDGLDLIVLG